MPFKIKNIGCKVENCLGANYSLGFCRKHYRQFTNEGKKRYQKVKNDLHLKEVLVSAVTHYRQTEAYKESKRKSDRKYYDKNKKELLGYKADLRERERFGVRRQEILDRDDNKCQFCNSGKSLVIHHKNGKGRGADIPDNDPNNLITLCKSCHMKIHNPFYLKEV